ncbi:serine/threonine kinase [Aureococcus anophagefferens]|nr:serine/threonine kinase [Aureococcus anophagefferens]
MAEERVLDVREIATLVTTLYADRLPASSSSSGVPAVRSSTGVSESSEEHGVARFGRARGAHDVGVVHRDVKLENILLRSPGSRTDAALADLGIARALSPGGGDRPTSLGGSVHYLSPEVVRREPYGTPVDVWGLGVALYALLTGGCPRGAPTAALFDDIERGDVDFETPEMRRVDAPTPRAPPTPAPSPLRSASPAPVETNVPDNVD